MRCMLRCCPSYHEVSGLGERRPRMGARTWANAVDRCEGEGGSLKRVRKAMRTIAVSRRKSQCARGDQDTEVQTKTSAC